MLVLIEVISLLYGKNTEKQEKANETYTFSSLLNYQFKI